MFGKLNISSVIIEYKESFKGDNSNILLVDKLQYFYLPYAIALFLCFIKLPDDNLLNLFGTNLSIFIGLFLNIIAILLSIINSKKNEINFSDERLRLSLLKETVFTILYAVLQGVKALFVLYLLSIITLNSTEIGEIYLIIFEKKIDTFIKFILTLFLYKYNISIFFSFYMIIKSIVSLFNNDINIETHKINEEENRDRYKS